MYVLGHEVRYNCKMSQTHILHGFIITHEIYYVHNHVKCDACGTWRVTVAHALKSSRCLSVML